MHFSYIVQASYENSLIVELDIASRKKFIHIERKLARLWECKPNKTSIMSISGQDSRDNERNKRDSSRFNAGRRRCAQ
ncbi:hypothetical protein AHAS_Ahas20G0125200 [Arachis hypogaea]